VDRDYVVDMTITELEQKLDPAKFIRINRGIVLGLNHLKDLHSLFGGRMVARLKDT
jgi:two-component system, LytTR family, response regulator